ncbi:MAG: hypothetical protein JSV84_12225 [Gemmatimonadota bacterium]|nr:MAG: hypothetical protein JSV84_12225 [Gemmatimonadota bacterium]
MSGRKYSVAGWLAIAGAFLFPMAFFIGIIHDIIAKSQFHYHGPNFGPSDMLFILFTGISAYTLSVFRDLLNERYNTHELDMVINIAIGWIIVFQVFSLCLKGIFMTLWPVSKESMTITYLCFMAVAMVIIGIVDILIAVKLLKVGTGHNELLKAYAYINLVAGALEVSVFLSPLAIILVPVSSVTLGMILLREKEGVEFV